MIVDSHVHYIEPASVDRPYAGAVAMQPISVTQVIERAIAAGVDRIVQVTASTMGTDNRYSLEGATAHPDRVLGVVGRFDPLAPDLPARLAACRGDPRMLGIRLTLFHDWSRHWLETGALEPFLHEAGRQGMPVFVHAPCQTARLHRTIRAFPSVRFVIDHMNIRFEPGMTAQDCFAQWAALCALAREPNAWIKVSYFPEAAHGSEAYPYPTACACFRQLYETAGADRLIWGSNFPPVERACDYARALDLFREAFARFVSSDEMVRILGGNFVADFSPSTSNGMT